ncbi:MAG TPA: dockerin type I domain-containing protein, partial [Pirellulales bacterium]
NNSAFADVDTQSPVVTSSQYYGGQVGGGLDDRFDFQLVSSALMDNQGMSYLSGSYHTVGNNGTAHPFNGNINDPSNNDPIGTAALNALAQASDHLPVEAQYQLPAKMGTVLAAVPSQVIVGANLNAQLTVTNTAGDGVVVKSAVGADKLSYSVTTSGAASGTADGSSLAAFATGNVHNFALTTTAIGAKSGTITVNATSAQVPNATQNLPVSYTVLDHANASFASPTDTNMLTLNLGSFPINSGNHTAGFNIDNLVTTAGFTAGLDLLGVNGTGDTSLLSTNISSFSNLAAGSSDAFQAALNTVALGAYTATYTLNLSDLSSLPGAASQSLTLTLTGTVTRIPGDLTLDNSLSTADVQEMMFALSDLSDYQSQEQLSNSELMQVADVNGDGLINNLDLQALVSELANPPAGGGNGTTTAVPEPASWALLLIGSIFGLRVARLRGTRA